MRKRIPYKKISRLRKIGVLLVLVAVIAIVAAVVYRQSVMPTVRTNVEASVKASGAAILNGATSTAIENTRYDEFFEIIKDTNGDIVMIRTNSFAINSLVRDCAQLSQTSLNALGEQTARISLGTFAKIPTFSGQGPDILIRYTPVGASECSFESMFVASGINQTLHSLYVNVSARIVVSTAAYKFSIVVTSHILVCENIIVGKVPDTYLTIGNLDLTV
ncbi:MAG: sporulation protein YunB [Clostridiaceae bacterium]|jgi:sporulation protein YunB|nr:sporulation protein YunB [Clostridiaceae bacterium]